MFLKERYISVVKYYGNKHETFEPTIIFFGLTNSLVMFQTIMNDLLKNMIEKEEVAAFINDVMIVIETKEECDEIVEEVLRKIE